MKRHNITPFLLLTIVLAAMFATAIPSVSAALVVNKYTNDFVASSPNNEQLKVCSCETKTDTIIVENTGDFIADFTLQVASTYPNTIKVAEPRFTLAPKHFKEVTVYVEDSCGVIGVFPYDVTVTNSYGRVQQLHRTIRVDRCQNVQFNVQPATVETGLCQPATFTVTTKNVGTFPDTFSLNFGPYDTIAQLPIKDMYLQPGESYTQRVSFTFDCKEWGVRHIPFNLLSQKNQERVGELRDVTIRNEYSFSMDAPTRVDACEQVTTQVPIDFKNLAQVEDELQLSLAAPTFASFAYDRNVYLGPNGHNDDSVRRIINLNPVKGTAGEYQMSVVATDIYGLKQKQRDVLVDVNNCYDPIVEMRDTPEHTITGDLKTCCGQRTFYVNVRNNGDREQLFRLKLDAPSFFKMEEITVRVAPGQNLNVPIYADLPCTDEAYDASVLVFPDAAPNVNVSTKLSIQSLTERTCHMVQIDDDEHSVKDDALVLPVMVKSTGIEGGTYAISINSTLFSVKESEITLNAGEQKAIHLEPKVNLSLQERGRYISQPKFTLVDPALNIPYNEHIGVELESKGFFQTLYEWFVGLPWGKLGLCGWVIILLAIIAGLLFLLLLLIYTGVVEIPSMQRGALTLLKTLCLIVIFLLLLWLVFLRTPGKEVAYERAANNTNPTIVEWYQNEPHTIQMNEYFEDPDHDIIRYTVTQPKDMKVTIDGTKLTLTPDYNFVGENTMIITANDQHGGITDSPVFKLHVIAKKNMGWLDWMRAWCHHIVAILAVLIVLFAFLIVLSIKERRQDLKKDNVIVYVPKNEKSTRASARNARAGKPAAKANAVVMREYTAGGKMKTMKVVAKSGGAGAFLIPGAKAADVVYVGSKGGNMVHAPDCMVARRIPKGKRIAYTSKKAAVKAGLVPCRMCRPFEGGI